MTCPALGPDEFHRLGRTSPDQVQVRFHRTVSELHRFLNERSAVRNLQSRRSAWRSPRDPRAFRNFKPESEHWYTFNQGGRSEAQLNIGMFPNRLRVGIGFEFTEKEHGDPNNARLAFASLLQAIRDDTPAFEQLVVDLPAEMEFASHRGGALEMIAGERVTEVLLKLEREPRWLFVGRMLRPDLDREILSNGVALGKEIDRIFSAWLPWWEKANIGMS